MAKAKVSKTYPCHCNQCNYDWASRLRKPKHCARCISNKWNEPLVGKKLRKAVASRARLDKKKKATGKSELDGSRPRSLQIQKERAMKAPRVPRVKKEKGALTPEQFDKKASEV